MTTRKNYVTLLQSDNKSIMLLWALYFFFIYPVGGLRVEKWSYKEIKESILFAGSLQNKGINWEGTKESMGFVVLVFKTIIFFLQNYSKEYKWTTLKKKLNYYRINKRRKIRRQVICKICFNRSFSLFSCMATDREGGGIDPWNCRATRDGKYPNPSSKSPTPKAEPCCKFPRRCWMARSCWRTLRL